MDIKICGLTSNIHAGMAESLGATHLGVVLCERSPRFVSPDKLGALFAGRSGKRVGVFVDASLDYIRRCVDAGGLNVVQLHGSESGDFACKIDFAEVWKAFPVSDDERIFTIASVFPASVIVADSMRGGSGCLCNWDYAARLSMLRPLFLAGGLNCENISTAINTVRPAGIDLNSGVESSPGVKDFEKMRKILKNSY